MPAKKVVKKTVKKVAKKAVKKTAKKVTKKTVKKTPKKAAKKVTKKAVKNTTRKAVKKPSSKTPKNTDIKVMVCAADHECFWTTDGQIFKDMEDLSTALDGMIDEVFMYHVSKERNDFADWVEHVLHDAACASALRRAHTPTKSHQVLVKKIKTYNSNSYGSSGNYR